MNHCRHIGHDKFNQPLPIRDQITRHSIMPTSISGAQGFFSIQEHDNLIESTSRTMDKLVILSESHETLKNEVDVLEKIFKKWICYKSIS
jgi:hypothetical protein